MARVMILGAISLAVLFMSVTVSSSRITITIAEDAENRPDQSQRCQQQIQQAQRLRLCQQYLRQQTQFQEEEDQVSRDQQQCCEQLQQIQEPQCRCEGLRQVVQQEQQRGELQGRERQQMIRTAENLPGLCRLSPQRCEIQTRSLF